MGWLRTAPKLNTVCPYWFEHAFVQDQLICERELRFASQKPVHASQFEVEVEVLSYIVRMCVYIHIYYCVQTVYELPLLTNKAALHHFYTNRSGAKC